MIKESSAMGVQSVNFFPAQMLTDKERTDDFYQQCIDAGLSIVNWNLNLYSSIGVRNTRKNKIINYNLFNDIVDKEEMNRVINPWGFDDVAKLPRYKNYSLLNSSLMLLFGEERRRVFNPIVTSINSDAVNERLRTINNAFTQTVTQSLINPNESPEETERKMQEFGKWANFEYKDRRARMAQQVINYLYRTDYAAETFSRGFEDLLIAGEEIYFGDVIGNKPVLRKGNPLNTYSLRAGTSYKIEDSDIIVEDGYLPLGEVLDRYYDDLSPKEIDALQQGFRMSTGKGLIQGQEANPVFDPSLIFGVELNGNIFNPNNSDVSYFAGGFDVQGNVRCTRVLWKGMRKVGSLETTDPETGETIKKYVDESYKPNKMLGEKVEWLWLSEWFEGTKIGNNVYTRMRPCPVQFRSMDNPSICKPPVVGIVVNVNANKGRSLVDMTREYQYLYNALMARMEMTMLKDRGKMARLDLSLIPDGWEMDKWMYYAEVLGWQVVDPFNEGQKGAATGKLAGAMNQNSASIDLEQGQYLQRTLLMADFIARRVEDITGINPQRKGAVDNRETVGGVERAVTQSSMSTEKWFVLHDNVRIRALKMWLELAKFAWRNEQFKRPYIMDDGSMGILDFDYETFVESEYGIDITSSSADMEMTQALKQLAQPFLQNGGNLSIVADLYRTTDPQSLQRKIEAYEQQVADNARQAQEQKNQIQMQQIEQANAQAEATAQREYDLEMAKLDIEKYKIDTEASTKIQVAQMATYNKREDTDLNKNGIPDPMEIASNALNVRKQEADEFQKELDTTLKYKLEQEKMDLEREKMQHDKELQDKKDKAAMAREKLKASAARKNKVSGEK